jgi:hypothetical protein
MLRSIRPTRAGGRGLTDLVRIVEAWPSLPDAVKAGIMAMIQAASKRQGAAISAKSDPIVSADPGGISPDPCPLRTLALR